MNHERPDSDSLYRILHDLEAMHGTSRQGYLQTSYDHLVSLFGEPLAGDGRKVDVQWVIETQAGIGTVYNYNLFGESTGDVQSVTIWHVGGKDQETYQTMLEIIQEE